MTDRELLELAAKAAGIEGVVPAIGPYERNLVYETKPEHPGGPTKFVVWRPLTDDGDALRLAVKLGMQVDVDLKKRRATALIDEADSVPAEWFDTGQQTPEQAARRAIVRAAAEIGMQKGNKGIDNNEAAPTIPPDN